MALTGMITPVARRSVAGITPEFYFQKTIDNSRLVRVADPQRRREVRMFTIAVCVLFMMTLVYTWQHFRSLEYGYQIEAQKGDHDRLVELNRSLTLEQDSLRDPRRIAELAHKMDLVVEDELLGQQVQYFTVLGQAHRTRFLHRRADIFPGHVARTRA